MSEYRCVFCEHKSARGWDQCPRCRAWGSALPSARPGRPSARTTLADVPADTTARLDCAEPWHTVLGGGLAVASTVIVYGKRGSLKTTRLVQLASSLASRGVLFACLEMGQNPGRLAEVAARVNASRAFWIARSSTLGELCAEVAQNPIPAVVIVDSLSSLSRGADEVAALAALRRAAPSSCALIVVCHVTKAGELAGAEELAHDCDVIVRATPDALSTIGEKNRLGALCEAKDDLAQRLVAK